MIREIAVAVDRLANVLDPNRTIEPDALAQWIDALTETARDVAREREALIALEVAARHQDDDGVDRALHGLERLRGQEWPRVEPHPEPAP